LTRQAIWIYLFSYPISEDYHRQTMEFRQGKDALPEEAKIQEGPKNGNAHFPGNDKKMAAKPGEIHF